MVVRFRLPRANCCSNNPVEARVEAPVTVDTSLEEDVVGLALGRGGGNTVAVLLQLDDLDAKDDSVRIRD